MPELDNLLPESFFTDTLAETEEVEEEEEVFFKGSMSLEEYVEQNPILGKTIEELKEVFVNNAQEWRKASWLAAFKKLYVLSKRKELVPSIPTNANGEYDIKTVNGRTVLKYDEIHGVDSILHYYGKFDCLRHKSFEKSKENFGKYKDPKKLISAMYSYLCSLDESEFKTKRLPEGHSNVQVVPLPDNLGVELYLPKEWTSIKSSKEERSEMHDLLVKRGIIFPKDHPADDWQRFVFKPDWDMFVECAMFSPYEIKPEEMHGTR